MQIVINLTQNVYEKQKVEDNLQISGTKCILQKFSLCIILFLTFMALTLKESQMALFELSCMFREIKTHELSLKPLIKSPISALSPNSLLLFVSEAQPGNDVTCKRSAKGSNFNKDDRALPL